jgi:putative heme-binding domain-containing protein
VDTLKIEKGKIFRFEGNGQKLEMIAHRFRNPYELCIDSYGNVFQSDNDNGGSPACRLNFILEYGDYGYGGGPAYNGSRSNAHPRKEVSHWRQNDPGIVPNLVLTGNGAPTGVMVYEGKLLPEIMQGQIFLCGHAQNMVRVYRRTPKGAGFETSFVNLVRGNVSWFRPTDVCTAGDGSVFVADWHDPASGGHRALSSSTGRIYRVAPKGVPYRPVMTKVIDVKTALEALKSPNIESRNLAAKFLRESARLYEVKSLLDSDEAVVRARAVYVMAEKKGAETALLKAFSDSDENVRIAILRAARAQGLEMSKLLKMASQDKSDQVKREAAVALKYAHDNPKLWATLAREYQAGDKMMLEALGVAADGRWDLHLFELFRKPNENKTAMMEILWRANSIKSLPYYVETIKDPEVPFEVSVKLFRAFDYYNSSEREPYLKQLLSLEHPDANEIITYALKHLKNPSTKDPVIAKAVNQLLDQAIGTEAFVNLVKQYRMKNKLEDIWKVLLENKANPLGHKALDALVRLGGSHKFIEAYHKAEQKDEWINLMGASKNSNLQNHFTDELLKKEGDLDLRLKLLKAVCQTTTPPRKVMAAINKGTYSKEEGYIETLEILAQCSAANVVDWAVVELTNLQGREPLSLNKLISLDGNAHQGKAVFEMACISCHVVGQKGIDFGPNLSRIGSKLGRFAMFDALLNPSAGIEFNFETIEVTMKNGQIFTGLYAGDTSEDYKLKLPGGVVQTLAKNKMVSQRKLGHSMMPAGIAKGMEPKQLAHLVTYLSSLN